MEEQALFVRDRDTYVGTILTQGGWDRRVANGGTVLALMGQHLDEVPTLVPMTLGRFTADLVRPVPVGQRLRVRSAIVRDGKKIQVVEMLLLSDDVEHARVTALRLRDEQIADEQAPRSTTSERPGDALAPPDQSPSFQGLTADVPGFLRAVDMRRARSADGSRVGSWIRLDVAVVAGEPVSPTARLTYCFDFANLIGLDSHPGAVTMINPDVTAHVLRRPSSEWIAITGDTRFEPSLGRGMSQALLSDDRGVFAAVSLSQLIQPR
jgi:hypothetical protein